MANFVIAGFESSHELVNAGVGCGELLGGDGGASFHGGGKSIGHCACDFSELVPAEADESFSGAGGQGGIGLAIQWWVDLYSEWRWRYLLDQWSG